MAVVGVMRICCTVSAAILSSINARRFARFVQRLDSRGAGGEQDFFTFDNAKLVEINLHLYACGAHGIVEVLDIALGTRHLIIATFRASLTTRRETTT